MTLILEDLLKELATDLKMDFQKDPSGSYSYQINESLFLQIEMDKTEDTVIIGSFFTHLPPGKFRENVLTNTLIANYILDEPSFFAFSEKKAELLLYQKLKADGLDSKKILENLTPFAEKALKWKEAIESGLPAPAEVSQTITALKRST